MTSLILLPATLLSNPWNSAMNNFLRTLALAILIIAAPAAIAAPPLHGDAAAAGQVWSTFERWLAAYEQGDLESTMRIFDPEVVFAFQGGPDQSYADLRKGYVADFAARAPGTVWTPQIEEIHAEGKLAFVRSRWELRVTSGGNTVVKERNRSIDIFHLSADGWKIIRSLNYPDR
jgi:ketosteroid isomerase-like protein